MKQLLEILTCPRWYLPAHGIYTICWLVILVFDGIKLRYKMARTQFGGLAEKFGPLMLYMVSVVALLFALGCLLSLGSSRGGRLRVHHSAVWAKILACASCVILLHKLVLKALASLVYGLNDPLDPWRAHYLVMTALMFVWALFLTIRVAFGKQHRAYR